MISLDLTKKLNVWPKILVRNVRNLLNLSINTIVYLPKEIPRSTKTGLQI